jgi:hypothetical protein
MKMIKKSIYYFSVIFVAIFVITTSINARGHSPDAMTLNYNSNTQTLSVTITHTVGDNSSHYIQSVVVTVNGSMEISQVYTSQPTLNSFSYNFSVAANTGARIQGLATCNQGGSVSACIIVGSGECPTTPGGGIPGYNGILSVFALSAIIMLPLIYKKLKH